MAGEEEKKSPEKNGVSEEDENNTTETLQRIDEYGDPAIIAAAVANQMVSSASSSALNDGGGGGGGGGKVLRYDRDELLKMRRLPSSMRRPEFLDEAYYNTIGVWDPLPWHYGNKNGENVKEEREGGGRRGGDGDGDVHPSNKRRSGDPRERLRKEQDGIVLSPQRRSFNSGCFVPLREPTLPLAADAPGSGGGSGGGSATGGKGDAGSGGGGIGGHGTTSTRRIGSGRILPWDYQDKADMDNDFGYRREMQRVDRLSERERDRERDRDEQQQRYERRSFGRDYDKDGGKEGRHMRSSNSGGGNGRFSNRRISTSSKEEEPEWFSSGPISQSDTIELRGFDDIDKISSSKKKQVQKKKAAAAKEAVIEKQQRKGGGGGGGDLDKPTKDEENNVRKHHTNESHGNSKSPIPLDGNQKGGSDGATKTSPLHHHHHHQDSSNGGAGDGPHIGANYSSDTSFNFEDILKCDSIPGISGLLSNGIESGDAAGSRFSRWFQREKSPPLSQSTTTTHNNNNSTTASMNKQQTLLSNTGNTISSSSNESRSRQSPQDSDYHHHIIKNLLGDAFNEQQQQQQSHGHHHHHHHQQSAHHHAPPPSVAIPQLGDTESYFAPISPAASSIPIGGGGGQSAGHKSLNLMEMLQRGGKVGGEMKGGNSGSGDNSASGTGKILSLEELEAKMMQGVELGGSGKPQPKQQEDDINAFKRLFAQMNMNGPNAQPSQQKPMSLMEMLSHSQQQDEAVRIAARMNPNPNIPPHLAEMSFKLQQVQNQVKQQQLEMLSKLMNAGVVTQQQQHAPQTRASPLQEMSRELLSRPEAQAILQGLKRGDITPQHLYQQLANPALQPRHRDLLITILKMQGAAGVAAAAAGGGGGVAGGTTGGGGAGGGPGSGMQQCASPVPPPHHLYQQQLRVSPLPPPNAAYCVSPIMATSPNTLTVPALHQRIPSPRELQVHTQNIMQRALIKKKLEEQEENFRKKQAQQQRGASPAKTSSPTPLTFTPTAVLRKMTAEKDDNSKDGKLDSKIPQGRAVTGMRTPLTMQPPPSAANQLGNQPNWTNHYNQQQQQKQAGRPIVKANNNYPQSQQPPTQPEQYFQQQRLLQQQQQQQQQQQHRKSQQQQPPSFPSNFLSAANQQFQQQLRAQHQNVRTQQQSQSATGGFNAQAPSSQQNVQPNWTQQMLQGGQNFGRGGLDGDLSPTSNQLARWFSPELLDKARKGKLPGIPQNAVAQHALSLEEVERQTTPVGHN